MKRRPAPDSAFRQAFAQVVARIQQNLRASASGATPVRMYVAGGAALHFHTGARVSEDIDATFSRRILLAEDIAVSWRDADNFARVLYLDRNYNDTLGLLHENAYKDAPPIEVPGLDRKLLEVRVLTPLDLAVTKLARLSEQDREDIRLLARAGLIDSKALRKRAEQALGGYVGDLGPVRTSIDVACRLVESERSKNPA